ncbi:unnamed protein product [Nezara viridula]|uniref:Uncharacterized protein n=1 Tax=Nezara viridula TaxID=85310 RepID=A0A9P0GWI3_NEZVI|nr:unnamed protein product [Nezara viridula]
MINGAVPIVLAKLMTAACDLARQSQTLLHDRQRDPGARRASVFQLVGFELPPQQAGQWQHHPQLLQRCRWPSSSVLSLRVQVVISFCRAC